MPAASNSDVNRRHQDYQRALTAFSRIAAETLSPDRLMNYTAAWVAQIAHIKHVKILRYRPTTGDLIIEAGVGWKPGVIGQILDGDLSSPAGRSVQTAMPVVIEDLPNDGEYRYIDILRDHGILSLVNVPVLIDGRNWGVLEADSEQLRTFDDGDIAFLSTIANILGIAMKCHEAQRLATAEAEKRLQSEARWETLIAEMRHRVKNNFQTIISFLSLHRRGATTDNSRDRFTSVMHQVQAIALVHDQLTPHGGQSLVKFGDFIHALCTNILAGEKRIAIEVDAADATISLDRAVSAGLIVNELITNAVKHGFDEADQGIVRVTFGVAADRGQASVVVEDNGRGLTEAREGGLGLNLVRALAGQLSGRIEIEKPEKGTRVLLYFPLAP